MGLLPQCGINIVTNTKNPLYILPTRIEKGHTGVAQCFELKDGRIISNINLNHILIYNLLNPTLVDIKIEYSNFDNKEIENIAQLDDSILIFSGHSPYIRLVQIESKSFKIIKTIDMSHYLNSCDVYTCSKLSNGQLAFSLHNKNSGQEVIALFGYDSGTKNLIYHYQFSLSGLPIYNILECKSNELLLTRMDMSNKEYTFFN